MITHIQAETTIAAELGNAGWSIAPEAMEPLQRIDFAKLVAIHDHEERFLQEAFTSTLVALRSARQSTDLDRGKITADDVKTALLMLGVAASRQAEVTLSSASKSIIKEACGFC